MKTAAVSAIIAATAIIVALNVACAVLWFLVPADFGLTALPSGEIQQLEPGGAAAAAGVRLGDRLVPSPRRGDVRAGYRALFPAAVMPLKVATRAGIVAVRARRFPLADAWTYALNFLACTIFTVCAALLFVRRPGPTMLALWLYSVTIGLIGPQGPLFALLSTSSGLVLWIFLIGMVAGAGPIAMLPFVLRFPTEHVARRWRRLDTAAWIAMPVAAGALSLYYLAALAGLTEMNRVWVVFTVLGQLEVAECVVLILRYRRMSGVDRARTAWAIAGFGGSIFFSEATVMVGNFPFALPASIDNATVLLRVAGWLGTVAALLPLLAIYPILRYRLFDLGFIVNRATLFSVLTLGTLGALAGVNWIVQRLVAERLASFLQPLAAIVVALVFIRFRGWVEKMLEQLFFRDRLRAETALTTVAESFAHVRDAGAVDVALTRVATETLSLTSGAVFRNVGGVMRRTAALGWEDATLMVLPSGEPFSRDVPRIEGLPTSPHDPVLAIALVNGDDRIGLVLYGRHRNETEVDPEEAHILRRLCRAAAAAYRLAELETENEHLRARVRALAIMPGAPQPDPDIAGA